jgi:hypothetical protein
MTYYYPLGLLLAALILREVRRIRRENDEVVYSTRHPPNVVQGQQQVLMAMAMQLHAREDPDLRAAFRHQIRLVRNLGFSEEPETLGPSVAEMQLKGPRADGGKPLGEWLELGPHEAKRVASGDLVVQ